MRRKLSGLVAASTLILTLFPWPQPATAQDVCAPPRCHDVVVPLPKGVSVPDSTARILLPEGYGNKKNRRVRYPVVYVLHGVGDTYESWTERTDIVEFTKQFDAIFVMPDGGRGPEAGWYSDWKDGSRRWETFHTNVLVRYVDDNFRTLGRSSRGILGASMGGFGAMSYAARHRFDFRAAASFSGAVDTMYGFPASGPIFHLGGQGVAGQSIGTPSERVWGNQITDEQTWRDHNPTDRAVRLRGVWLYVASGMGTPGGAAGDDPAKPHAYATENGTFQMNLSFTRALDGANVEYTTDFGPGYHDWPYWEHQLHEVLPQLLEALAS